MGNVFRRRWMFSMFAVAMLTGAGATMAQSVMGPRSAPLPSYGPPTSPLLEGHELSQFSNGFVFQLEVELAELQRFLPAGYTPVASPAGGTTARVAAIFGMQNFLRLNAYAGDFAPGSYGPFDSFDLLAGALPPGSSTVESVVIARFVNNVEIADLRNALYGPGTNRYADIDVRTKLSMGQREMTGRVHDEELGFRVVARQTGLDQVATSLRNIAFPGLTRLTDFAQLPPVAGIATNTSLSSDNTAQLTDPAALEVKALRIKLGGGHKMQVLHVLPGSFSLNQERHLKNR